MAENVTSGKIDSLKTAQIDASSVVSSQRSPVSPDSPGSAISGSAISDSDTSGSAPSPVPPRTDISRASTRARISPMSTGPSVTPDISVDTRPEIEVIHGMTFVPILDRFVPTSRIWLAFALLVLNICDVLTTRLVLTNGGIEVNPIMVGLMQGTAAPLLLKSTVSVIAGLLLIAAPRSSRRSERAVATVVGLYLAIVLWNLAVFIRL